MLVICYGMAKSGSTLAFELTKGILSAAGHDQGKVKSEGLKKRRGGNYIAELTRDSVTDIVSAIEPGRIVAAKTHKCFEEDEFAWYEDMQAQRKIQVVASYRDPRDMCLSLIDHGARSRESGQESYAQIEDLKDAARLVSNAIPKFRKWASLNGSVRLSYDTVAFSPDAAIDTLESVLGVTCDHEAARKHAFEDSFTQRNKAQKMRFESEMDDQQKRDMQRRFGEFIERVCGQNDQQWFSSYREQVLR
ncbi:MAG TPA: hypothetical protein VMF58_15615 [Rhizomicrobium sp.]|nr:hypothetical protein [Rhizomicrobium sp.]